MKNTRVLFFGCFLLLFIQLAAQNKIESSISQVEFKTPPAPDHIYTWWHFIDNHITKEGITKDLEAMKQQGIYGVTMLNVNRFDGSLGNADVKFNSPQWYDMFKHALHEAKRLDMQIGVQNCDGWSTSGGPWITPEYSMKQYVWSKTLVSGGKNISVQLDKPAGNSNFYRDAAVVAYRSAQQNSFNAASPSIILAEKNNGKSLIDGNPSSSVGLKLNEGVVIKFKKDFAAEVLLVHTQRINSRHGTKSAAVFKIESSQDGENFKYVGEVTDTILNETLLLPFPLTNASIFRVSFKSTPDGEKEIRVSELALLKPGEKGLYQPKINALLSKTVSVSPDDLKDIYTYGVADKDDILKSTEVVDLTGKMQADGIINWQAPAGDWAIVRFGYTTTGKKNHPATKEGEGLECDKMDTAALNLHFKNFPQKLIDAAGDLKGNTFSYLFLDSWEASFQNWTNGFEKLFESKRGYSMLPYVPVLCGEVVGSMAYSEAFLHDYRKTIAELIEENYYKHFSDLCHRQGLQVHAESIYGGVVYPPIDVLKCNSYADVPMTEFWAPVNAADTPFLYNPKTKMTATLPTHAAILYNKPVVGSEAYTGFAMYSDAPWDIKLYGDNAFTEGVNRIVLHSYVNQPTEKKPGVTLGMYGLSFNRHNTWWPYASSFFTEQARVQNILQKGVAVADILIYAGDRYPYEEDANKTALLSSGIKFTYCNADVLLNRIKVKDGKLILNNNLTYQMLVIKDSCLELSTLGIIANLVRQGATVVSPKIMRTYSLKDYDKNNALLQQTISALLKNNSGTEGAEIKYGKGRIILTKTPDALIKGSSFTPDVQVKGANMQDIMFIHKIINGDDFFYLVNKSNNQPVQLEIAFRITGKDPSVWDAMDGSTMQPALYVDNNSTTTLPLFLRPKQSLFVVFTEGKQQKHFVKMSDATGRQQFPVQQERASQKIPVLPCVSGNGGDGFKLTNSAGGQYIFTSDQGKSYTVTTVADKNLIMEALSATVTLESEPGISPFKITTFNSLTQSDDPAIKYYSGTANYTINYYFPAGLVTKENKIFLQLDQFGAAASVKINDSPIAVIWEPGYKIDVTSWIKVGENQLIVKAANPWRNRLIGDMINTTSKRTWTTSPFKENGKTNVINKNSTLLTSGISKPLKIFSVNTSVIKY